ncbi:MULTISPECIES: ROK family protein [unclassified Caulobacter]|uniref:ROK family protein n=1 Tax=unclassified Caulobacter TaxID=2648921 RepID=UPI000D34E921|nr:MULTISPECIES: ROK family protein [unclassified Caulobacter]PTS81610.1 fructokinase [Caulobacter sp. HMWF009]PTT08217.1 fructokinase [Caulobacter sp. HMWF025]
MVRIGVDFGGTKIEAAVLSGDDQIIATLRTPTPADYDSAIAAVRDLIDRIEQQVGAKGSVGIGAPGSISPRTGVMRNANATYLNGRTFREDLSVALGRPVRLANDANCLALSEAIDGAAKGARTTFAVILGTGCGGGLVVDGKLIEGASGVGGEWGHIPLPWPDATEAAGPQCWCGQRGCVETWVSGSGLRRDFRETTGRDLSGEAILAAAAGGDAVAQAAFDRLAERLGRALAVICNIVDPDVFVLGGGLSNIDALYQRLPGLIAPYVFADQWEGRIVKAHWGDSSGVRGAARLWDLGAWSADVEA